MTNMLSRRGFTLLEIAIVITIIGVLIGGMMTASGMLNNAQLMRVGSDIERYRQATASFQMQYKELPGDFTRAEALWGSDSGCPGTAANTVPKTLTCNGNGSNKISDYAGEPYRFWQHLANAKLIDGSYTGAAAPTVAWQRGINFPALPYNGGMIYSAWIGTVSGNSTYFDDQYGNTLSAIKTQASFPLFTPEDAKVLDKKFDDGFPNSGDIKPLKNQTACMNSGLTDYSVSAGVVSCTLVFKGGF